MGGYMNRALDIDLSSGGVAELRIDAAERAAYLGGKGLAARLLYDHTPAGLDPFDERMVIIFSTGPVTGSAAPQSNRFVVTTKSPLTGGVGSSTCGGSFATRLKKAGVDLVLVRGRSPTPVYIEITEGGVAIKDATHLWGLGCEQTQALLPRPFGKAVIGPAGENRVRYACVVSEERVAGRTGCGAVMGSKNLKAIIANGSRELPIENPAAHTSLRKSITRFLLGHPMTGGILPRLGTANIVMTAAGRNILPVNNFQRGTDLRAPLISGEALAKDHLKKRVGCQSCPIICGRGIAPPGDGPNAAAGHGAVIKGPEYETIGLLGSNLGCFDLKRIFEWNTLCDDLGMDTISCGGAIGFATELTQRGLLESDLSFDRHDGISNLLKDIAHRRSLGADLAEGTRRMSEKYGGKEYANQVKGLELPAYDPRGCYGQGLEYATTNRGGCHIQGGTMYMEAVGPISIDPLSIKAKPQLVIIQQNLSAAVGSSVFCMFSTYALVPALAFSLSPQGAAYKALTRILLESGPVMSVLIRTKVPLAVLWFEKFLAHVTGRRTSMGTFNEIGERAFNMERVYNLREGLSARDDTLPERMLREPTFTGVNGGVPLDRMLPTYYRLRGWDTGGVPTAATLKRLSIRT